MNKGFDIFILSNKNKVKIEVVTKLKKKVKLLFNKYLLVLFKTETFIFTLFQNVAQNFNTTAKPERSWALARSQMVIGKNIRERKSVFYRLIALD